MKYYFPETFVQNIRFPGLVSEIEGFGAVLWIRCGHSKIAPPPLLPNFLTNCPYSGMLLVIQRWLLCDFHLVIVGGPGKYQAKLK